MKLTPNEQKELQAWLAEGYPENSNPWYMTGENGKELDFVSAMRLVSALAEERIPF